MAAQSVRFSTERSPPRVNAGRGWSQAAARAWLQTQGFRAPRADRGVTQLRFRQFPPGGCQNFTTLTEDFPVGVTIVDCTRS